MLLYIFLVLFIRGSFLPLGGGFFPVPEDRSTKESPSENNGDHHSDHCCRTINLTAIFQKSQGWVLWINGQRLDSKENPYFFQWHVVEVFTNGVSLMNPHGEKITVFLHEPKEICCCIEKPQEKKEKTKNFPEDMDISSEVIHL